MNITGLGAAPAQSLRSPRAPLRGCREPRCGGLQSAGSPAGCRCSGLVGAVAAGMAGMAGTAGMAGICWDAGNAAKNARYTLW